MGIIETIKRGFGIVHKNLPIILIVFIFNGIGSLLRLRFAPAAPALGTPPTPEALVLTGIMSLVGILVFGGILGSLKDYIKTQNSSPANFFKHGCKYYLKLLATWLLIGLVMMIFVALSVFGVGLGVVLRNLVGVVLALAFVLIAGGIGIYLFILLFLSPYVVVADDTGPIAAIQKSVQFTRKSVLTILGLLVLLLLITVGMGFLVGVVAGVISFIIKGAAGRILVAVISSIFNAYVNVLLPACFLLYYMASSKPKEEPAAS